MRKTKVLLLITLLFLTLTGCEFFWSTTRDTVPITNVTTTGVATIDMDYVLQELYNRIYEDLYDDVRAEVIGDLAEERFDLIYADVIAEVVSKIGTGEIDVTVDSVVARVYSVAANSAEAVVGISNLDIYGAVQSIGSGVLYKHVGDKYYVVTNQHVVEDGSSFQVQFADETTVTATLRGVDELVDVAVLYFTSANTYPIATFGDSDLVTKGTIVLASGNPSGYDFYGSVSMGIVSGIDRYFDIDNDLIKDMFVDYIQHDAAINAGNSGGALFNLAGEVIGINVIKIAATEIEGMGFAIPANLVTAIISDIEEFGYSKQKPVLGITFLDIASTDPAYFVSQGYVIPSGVTEGFYIISVKAGATMEGIALAGDIITQIGDVLITDTDTFVEGFSKYRVGDVVSVVLLRNGSPMTINDIVLKANVTN